MLYITDPNSVKGMTLHLPRDNDKYVTFSKSLCGIRKKTQWKVIHSEEPTADGIIICQNCLSTAKMQIKKRHFESIWQEQYKARRSGDDSHRKPKS